VLAANAANAVPLSESGWAVVGWLTLLACVLWLVGVVVATRWRGRPTPQKVVDPATQKDPSTPSRVSARVVLGVVVAVAVLAVVAFLLARAGDLLA
jgi:Na+-transporting methylmalonyl-CoA/oxaloacetate decarboxylase gamma subunit